MRIAFVTPWNVEDPRAWSGVVNPMYEALSRFAVVVPVMTGDIRPALVDRVACRLSEGTLGRGYLVGHALATAVKRSGIVRRRIAVVRPDVVLGVAASQDVAFLRVPQPIVLVSDATFAAVRDYYPLFSNLLALLSAQAEVQEAQSLRKARRYASPTRWVQRSLVSDYAVPIGSITIIPFGPALQPEGEQPQRSTPGDPLRLLAVAGEWQRKGGDLVVAAFRDLQRRGARASLTVVGDAPSMPDGIASVGRVDRRTMKDLYARHDVLLELTRANCAGVTLTDAAAFGMPVVATRTGGVDTIVEDGVTGLLVGPTGDVAALAAEAVLQMSAPDVYSRMSRSARLRHERLLNWDAWARETLRLCFEAGGSA